MIFIIYCRRSFRMVRVFQTIYSFIVTSQVTFKDIVTSQVIFKNIVTSLLIFTDIVTSQVIFMSSKQIYALISVPKFLQSTYLCKQVFIFYLHKYPVISLLFTLQYIYCKLVHVQHRISIQPEGKRGGGGALLPSN